MRAALSIVIPTLNAEGVLPATLIALMEGVEAGLVRELIISDGGSTDSTRAIADDAGATVVTGSEVRAGQVARGLAAARGEWILILDAEGVLGPGWVDAVTAQLAMGGPGYFPLRYGARGIVPRLAAGWANRQAAWFGKLREHHGLLVSRRDCVAAGGDPDRSRQAEIAWIRALPRLRALTVFVEVPWAGSGRR